MDIRILKALLLAMLALTACKTTEQASGNQNNVNAEDLDPSTQRKVDVLYVEACTQMMRGDYKAASDLFRDVLESDPSNHAAMYNIAKLAIEQRSFSEAIDYGKAALKLDPDNFWYYQILEKAYEFRGDFTNAVAVQEKITQRFGDRLNERLKLADLYIREQKFDLAIEQLNYIESRVGPNEETMLKKLQLYVQQDKHEEAAETAAKLLELDPQNLRYYEVLFETQRAFGKDEDAVQTLESLLKKDPGNGFALLNLADIYKAKDQIEKSDQYLFQAFENTEIPVEEKVRIVRGLLQFAGQQDDVMPRVNTLTGIMAETHPGNAEVFAVQGDLFSLEEKYDSAYVYYRKSVSIDGTDENVWMGLLLSAFQKQDNELLRDNAEEALEYFPNQEEFLFFYGVSSSQLNEFEAAIYALEKLKRVGTSNLEMLGQAYGQLGYVYNEQGKFEKSDLNFDKALEINPDDHLTLNNYAYYLSLRKEKLEHAKEMIEKALKLQPNQASYQDTYGWVLYQLGEYSEAEKWIKKALDAQPNAELHEHFGDVLYKLGKKDLAIAEWNKAIEMGATELNINEKTREP